MRDDIGVWLIASLIILLFSSIILYTEPSFPIVVLGVYNIEILMYANLFINNKKFHEQETRIINKSRLKEIFQLEKDD